MEAFDISIADMLNGRVEGEDAHRFVAATFAEWLHTFWRLVLKA